LQHAQERVANDSHRLDLLPEQAVELRRAGLTTRSCAADGHRRFSARHGLDAQWNYSSTSLTGVLLLGPRVDCARIQILSSAHYPASSIKPHLSL